MSVTDTKDLERLDAILFDRRAGRNIIGHAIDTIESLRKQRATMLEALVRVRDTRVFIGVIPAQMVDEAILMARGETNGKV